MSTTKRSPASPGRDLGDEQLEALTVAMIVAPGVYARNRMFRLFASPGAMRARTRAGVIRGVVRQLARATEVTLTEEPRDAETVLVLRYEIVAMSLKRLVELTNVELAALRLAAERARIRCLPPGPEDQTLVTQSLTRLLDGGISLDVARLAREIVATPAE